MSPHSEKVKRVAHRIEKAAQAEARAGTAWVGRLHWLQRWFWMLYHEILRDDVVIRAQSLAFLMIFSLLPLIAGAFFIFTFLTQFGMVQDALRQMVESFLGHFPLSHREVIHEYIVRFKDAYLENITRTSRSVGIFALAMFGWIGFQAFNNIDSTLNFIWGANRQRPFLEKARNFIVVAVVAPLVLTGGFSVPLILEQFSVTRYAFELFPLLGVLLNTVIPLALLLGIFVVMYRYVPVRRVWWRSAFCGGAFATVFIGIVNELMRVYFAYGTHSAYGKAAVVPLLGFWMYALWIVVILGAEVSFIVQNGSDVFEPNGTQPTPEQGRGLLAVLIALHRAHYEGSGPLSLEALRAVAKLGLEPTRQVIDFLKGRGLIIECVAHESSEGEWYTLGRDLGGVSLVPVLEDFFSSKATPSDGLSETWQKGLQAWHGHFDGIRIADLANTPAKP